MTDQDDAQRRVFTDATEADWATDTGVLGVTVVHHPDDPGAAPIRTPEEWDATDWDADRGSPKDINDARAALAERITNPHAPDTPAVACAYDEVVS
jgi:hypothetical protein